MLSQLSYSPLTQLPVPSLSVASENHWELAAGNWRLILVGLGRLELPTSPLSGVRSSHLSYRPVSCGVPELKFTSFELQATSFERTKVLIARSSELVARSSMFFEDKVERASRLRRE